MTFELAPGSWATPPTNQLLMGILQPLEADVPGLTVRPKIDDQCTVPLMLARVVPGAFTNDSFHAGDDYGQITLAVVDIHVYCYGINAEDQAAALSEIAYQALRGAWLGHKVIPGIGSINKLRISSRARKANDWQTGTGVQQYSNLPKGTIRYQATYGLAHRPDRRNRLSAEDLVALATS